MIGYVLCRLYTLGSSSYSVHDNTATQEEVLTEISPFCEDVEDQQRLEGLWIKWLISTVEYKYNSFILILC